MTRPFKILIVEPHAVMRTSLNGVLAIDGGFQVAGSASEMLAALRLADQVGADVAIVDDRAATLSLAATRASIGALAKRVPVIVIGMGEPAAYTKHYLEAGASGYWCKTADFDELTTLIREAATARPRAA